MGETVNHTWEAAAQWQRYVVWIRMNVAYIRAELPGLAARGNDVSDIEALLGSFEPAFERFCASERGVFVSARAVEIREGERPTLMAGLQRARESFAPWLEEYHAVVEKMTAAGEPSLPQVLLLGCGAELLKSQKCLADVMDAYRSEVEQQAP